MFEPIPQMLWVAMFLGIAGTAAIMSAFAALELASRAKHHVELLAFTLTILTLEGMLSYTLFQAYGIWVGLEALVRALSGHEIRIPDESGAATLAIVFVALIVSAGVLSVGFVYRARGVKSAVRHS